MLVPIAHRADDPTTRRDLGSPRSTLLVTGAIVAATILACPRPAAAHDYWLLPEVLVAPSPRPIPIRMFVGEAFVAEEERPHKDARTERAVVAHAGAVLAVAAVDDQRPAYALDPRAAGGHLLAVDRGPANITLAPEKFERYLREEGLGAIVEQRRARGESGAPGRERYKRYLKTLIQIGEVDDATFGVELGQTLEILPEADPTRARGALSVRVEYGGVGLGGATLEAVSITDDRTDVKPYVTNAEGRVEVTIDRPAIWMLRLVHMTRCERCDDADWASFWSSYTFASRPDAPASEVRAIVRMEPRAERSAPPPAGPRPPVSAPWWLVGLAPALAIGALLGRIATRRS